MSLEAVQLAQALAVQEQAVARPSEPEAAAVAAQDVPQEAAEVRDERLAAAEEAAALPSAEQRQAVLPSAEPSVAPSVAPQALSLLAARLVRQRTRPPPREPEVMRFEWSRSQSLRAGSIEFVSWRPVREKESNNVLE